MSKYSNEFKLKVIKLNFSNEVDLKRNRFVSDMKIADRYKVDK